MQSTTDKTFQETSHPVPSTSSNTSRFTPVAAVATSILGVLTALWPSAPILDAITTAVPQLQIAIPLLLTSVGSIVAALSRSPKEK